MIFALFDKQSGLYMQPFFDNAAGVACRNIADEISRGGENNVLAHHPEDFELWRLGVFDEESGAIEARSERLVEVSTLVALKQ